MDWAPPFSRGPPELRNGPPGQGRDHFYNSSSRSEEKAGAAYPPPRGQHGFLESDRSRAGSDWRPGASALAYQAGQNRGPSGGPAARVERREGQPWDSGRGETPERREQCLSSAQGVKHPDCLPRPWGPYPQDYPPRPPDHPPPALQHPPNPWSQAHEGQPLRPQAHQQKEHPSHLQPFECRDQPCPPGAFLRQDHPPYQDQYPQQAYHLPQPPPQQKHLDSQQQYPFRTHSHVDQRPPFPERVGPPLHVQNVTSQPGHAPRQSQIIPQSGGLNLSAGYGLQNSQVINQGHNDQQSFPNLSVAIPTWKKEHGIQYKSGELPMPWPGVANLPQGLKENSMDPQQRNESVTKFSSLEQVSYGFGNNESTKEQDEFWLMKFLSKHKLQPAEIKKAKSKLLVSDVKETVLGACQLVAELTALCQHLRQNVENEEIWTGSYLKAIEIKTVLQEKIKTLTDSEYINTVKKKLETIKKKRRHIQRKKQEWCLEKQEQKARRAEKEAKIDIWRAKRVREVEEKKRERELKAAADSVLSEVRKKQTDAKRLVDILRALEKLRKLRKEAAARKGVHPPPSADKTFDNHVERLRKLIKKRSDLYDAEERALRVMLEGEQEEERKRENEKKIKKEKEKLEKQQYEIESMLFGEPGLPPDHPLQPFRQYYLQAENSSHVLVQIRQEWDRYLVLGEHPDGSSVPQGWVFPHPPSSDVWGTALKTE
ncbi:programmed cell death protein 7 [Narcine bancroftii]|uniref:programmed cell death protein 7 n=1 Tax=Narcine bancroftii TaxID=1343680 RepID=UPI003831DE57